MTTCSPNVQACPTWIDPCLGHLRKVRGQCVRVLARAHAPTRLSVRSGRPIMKYTTRPSIGEAAAAVGSGGREDPGITSAEEGAVRCCPRLSSAPQCLPAAAAVGWRPRGRFEEEGGDGDGGGGGDDDDNTRRRRRRRRHRPPRPGPRFKHKVWQWKFGRPGKLAAQPTIAMRQRTYPTAAGSVTGVVGGGDGGDGGSGGSRLRFTLKCTSGAPPKEEEQKGGGGGGGVPPPTTTRTTTTTTTNHHGPLIVVHGDPAMGYETATLGIACPTPLLELGALVCGVAVFSRAVCSRNGARGSGGGGPLVARPSCVPAPIVVLVLNGLDPAVACGMRRGGGK